MPLTVLVATDSYKGSLGADAATRAIARGLASALPDARIDACPMSDGGEGFIAATVEAAGGAIERAMTTDALGRPIEAAYGVLDGGRTVAIELSSAAGLAQLAIGERDPLVTTTFGVGTLIATAWERHHFSKLLLALGGSATVDGGAGLLAALGVKFLDHAGRPVPPGGGGLARLARVDASGLHPALTAPEVLVAVDVTNPLLGPRGAAPVYGPQKGASPLAVAALETGLARYADALERVHGRSVHGLPGTGSAGGVPAGLLALTRAKTEPGFELVAGAVGLEARLSAADVVVTGEGQLDRTSFEGKVVGRLATRLAGSGKRLVAVVGAIDPEGEALLSEAGGVAFSLVPGPMRVEEAMQRAEAELVRLGRAIGRLLN